MIAMKQKAIFYFLPALRFGMVGVCLGDCVTEEKIMVQRALVVEGGAMRGIFAAGVLGL